MKSTGLKTWQRQLGLLLGLCGIVGGLSQQAIAEALRLHALVLPYASPWQRASPQREADDDALLLDVPQDSLQVAVLRHANVVKTDAEVYFARLTRNWQALYGAKAMISWLEFGGQRWLACQRPAREGGGYVWHLSTLFDGRSYNLLLFTTALEAVLPPAAHALMARAHFGAESAQSASPSGWFQARTFYPKTTAALLSELVQNDIARLGVDGLVTGYGLDFSPESSQPGMAWFIEGYQWKTLENRARQVAWVQGSRLEALASNEWANWRLKLTLQENESEVRAHLRIRDICAAIPQVADALDRVQRGDFDALTRLAQDRAEGCPAIKVPAEPFTLQGVSGKTVQADTTLPFPPVLDLAQRTALKRAGLTHKIVLELSLVAGSRRTGYGDRLLERAHGYVLFESEAVGLSP